jgi:PRC-barrel domain
MISAHRSVRKASGCLVAKLVPGKQTVGMKVAPTHLTDPAWRPGIDGALNRKGEEPMLSRAAIARGGLAGCLILVAAWLAQGQIRQRTESAVRSTTIQRVSSVIGASVQIEGGTAVAKVEDLVINDDGCIDFVVVRYEERFVPIPWSLATVAFDQRIVTVDITRERFAQAPSFAGNRWADLRGDQFTGKVRSFFGDGKRRDSEKLRPESRPDNLKRDQLERRSPADQSPERPRKEPAKDKSPQRPERETKDKPPQKQPEKEPAKDKPSQTQPERP